MSGSALKSVFKLAFECAPIVLSGGLAENIPGKMLPLLTITETASFISNLVSGSTGLDKFFAHFAPMPGGTLIENQIGTYPFANQAVAANAIISQPLTLSMMMICPAQTDGGGYPAKLITMLALREALYSHCNKGGTFIVITPSYFYTDMILLRLHDVTQGGKQVQQMWQFDFTRPLLTQEEADAAQNSMMSKISNGSSFTGTPTWSGLSATTGSTGTATSGLIPTTNTDTTSTF